jgi:hypothetical protein
MDTLSVSATPELRRFKMHPKLLMDVIRRQAGTLGKAIVEGVQNSIDAQATGVDITTERGRVVIADDGGGFPSREEVEKFFEVFGQPHDASERKVYGTFRMGRGQMFAFGRNQWRSGQFAMEVDIEKFGLDYELHANLETAPGCRIEIALYEPLDSLQLHDLERGLAKLVKYTEIPVRVNGVQVNKPGSAHQWKHTTEDAWFDIRPGGEGSIDVYNLGVHVAQLSSWTHGCSGTVVTRAQVKVNFARNDIMSTCPVWRRIQPVLRELSGKGKVLPNRVTPSQRANIWREVVAGGGDLTDYLDHKLFVDANGDLLSANQIQRGLLRFGSARTFHRKSANLCFASHGSDLADRVMQAHLALVLDQSMIEMAGLLSEGAFLQTIWWGDSYVVRMGDMFTLRTLDDVGQTLGNREKVIIPYDDLKSKETIGLRVAEAIGELVKNAVADQEFGPPDIRSDGYHERMLKRDALLRRIRVGESDHSDGWTDGSTYIAVRRKFLADLGSEGSFVDLTLLLMHEYCHRTASVGDHSHDLSFYREYHELTRVAGKIAGMAKGRYEQAIISAGRRAIALKAKEAKAQLVTEATAALAAQLLPS